MLYHHLDPAGEAGSCAQTGDYPLNTGAVTGLDLFKMI